MKDESIIALSEIINVQQDRLIKYNAQLKDSITSHLESESGTIFMYQDITTSERYVVKIKSENYYIGLEQLVNQEHSEYFKQQFYTGCDLIFALLEPISSFCQSSSSTSTIVVSPFSIDSSKENSFASSF